jgi:hypothetical protein
VYGGGALMTFTLALALELVFYLRGEKKKKRKIKHIKTKNIRGMMSFMQQTRFKNKSVVVYFNVFVMFARGVKNNIFLFYFI